MDKRFFRYLVLFALIISANLSDAQTVTNVNGLRYLIDGNNAIVGRQDKELSGNIIIPETIDYNGNSYTVSGLVEPTNITAYSSNTVTVEGGAFQDCKIQSIVLPNTIKTISAGAFNGCKELSEILLPSNTVTLGAASFAGCSKLESLDIPATVENLGSGSSYGFVSYVFGGCSSLKNIRIPSGVKTLAAGCFMNCGLDSLYIPETITTIGDNSLYIPNLKALTIAIKDIRNIYYSQNAFANVSATTLYVPKGSSSLYQEYEPWSNFKVIKEFGEEGEIITPDQVTVSIDDIKYTLKNDAATIARQSTSLEGDIIIPEVVDFEGKEYKVTSIVDCKDITCYSGGSIVCEGGAFQNTNIKSIVLPNSITKIPSGAFQGCRNLEQIVLPNALTQLGAAALAGCSKLSSISLPESLKDLASTTKSGYRSYTFGGCTSLKNITIPNKVTRLASGSFMNSGIETITIHENLTKLDNQCLKTNTIKTLKICIKDMDNLSFTDDCFGTLSNCDLIVPKGSKQVYQEYYPWMNCKSITEYDDGSEPFIPTKLTVRINGVRYILKDGIATVGRQNKELTGTIIIPSQVTYGDNTYVVSDMVSPTDIIAWSDNEVTCTNGAFQKCCVDTIVLPNTIKTISAGAFNNCTNLKYIQLPANTKQLGTACFANCSNLEEIFLPETITSFGSYTKYGFKSYIFGGCSKLRKVNMPKGINTLAEGSLKNSGLEIFLISSNITTLQEDCFNARKLKAIKITHKDFNNLSYTESCFSNVSNVDLYVPEGCASLYREFYPWKNFKSITEYVDTDDEFQYNAYKVRYIVPDEENIESQSAKVKMRTSNTTNDLVYYQNYVASGIAITEIPTPEKDGYKFVKWENLETIMPAKDLTVRAVFEKNGTAVENVITDVSDTIADVYSINGTVVLRNATQTELNSLPKGIYIWKNQKIIIK